MQIRKLLYQQKQTNKQNSTKTKPKQQQQTPNQTKKKTNPKKPALTLVKKTTWTSSLYVVCLPLSV